MQIWGPACLQSVFLLVSRISSLLPQRKSDCCLFPVPREMAHVEASHRKSTVPPLYRAASHQLNKISFCGPHIKEFHMLDLPLQNFRPVLPSLPISSLWVIPVYQPQATGTMHRTWTGNLFHIWYYKCFNAILPNHPTLSLSHRVQKTILYICVSFAVSHIGLSLPSF